MKFVLQVHKFMEILWKKNIIMNGG
jgi:hypothetical protein